MGKLGKLKRSRDFDTVPEEKMVMRFVDICNETINRENKTFQVVVATENPVERYDLSRGVIVREVLSMDGIEWRGNRNQLPIVDSHDRSTVANVLGSVRNLRVEGDELIGDAYFGASERSQEAFQNVLDGHLTDFSITATPKRVAFVERGQSYTNRRGEEVQGPADIVTKWMPTDASLCATGADERSVVRRSYTDLPTEIEREMNESLLAALQGMGLPEGLDDPDMVTAWIVGNLSAKSPEAAADAAEEPVEVENEEPMPQTEEEPMAEVTNADAMASEDEVQKAVDRALKSEQKRRSEITAICKRVNIEREYADQLVDSGCSIEVARQKVLDRIAEKNQPIGGTGDSEPRVNGSQIDRMQDAIRDGLVSRAFTGANIQRKPFEEKDAAVGHEDFQRMGFFRCAERMLAAGGVRVERMSPRDIAMVALGHEPTIRRLRIQRDGEAYHVTGSFANLLLDAANKTLLAAYDEAEFTWNMWARQAPSTPDMKTIHRMRFSEYPDLLVVPENKDYKEGPMSDSKESYSPSKHGRIFSITWETVVNDDLDAISRFPAIQGTAARRTQNKKVYEVLTANDNMADGNPLFDSAHSNLAGSTGAPSVTTLNALFTAMRTQTGLGGEIINVTPRYLIVPAALEATALELFTSTGRPDVGGDTTGNSGVQNIYGPNGRRSLSVIAEPQLDGNSTTAWYAAASASQVDTVELTFLQGEESPVIEENWNFHKDVYEYKVRQTFGVKAIDWRGLYKNAG